MATKSNPKAGDTAAKETIDRIRELNERIVEGARAAGGSYLDAYEKTLSTIVGYQEQLADKTPVDWIQNVIEAQATFTREIGNLYAKTARDLLKR